MKRTLEEVRGAIAMVALLASDTAGIKAVVVLVDPAPASTTGATVATNTGDNDDLAIAMLESAIKEVRLRREAAARSSQGQASS